MPTVLNAANEVAVDAFLAGRIRFPEIAEIVGNTLEHVAPAAGITIEEVLAADDEARLHAQECIDSRASDC